MLGTVGENSQRQCLTRRRNWAIASLFGTTTMILGCQAPLAETPETPKIQVITTFLPMTQFTKAVAGERADVSQLMPTTVGPHDYQARPEDVQRLSQAQVLVKNGLEVEAFLAGLINNAENPDLKVIDSSQGITPIPFAEIEGEVEHDHGHDDEAAVTTRGHSHAGDDNPHIWLDPKRVIVQVENIRDGLIAADPEGKTDYETNAAGFIAELKKLDQENTTRLQPFTGKTFVAFHDFAPYFAQSYDLKAVFLVNIPEANPAPEDVRRVTQAVQQANLKAILTEPQASENTFAALAQDLNVKISTFDPMETGPATAIDPEYYLQTMRQNVQNLVTALGGTSQSQGYWQQGHLAVLPPTLRLILSR